MKHLILLIILASCASKYETHHAIDKRNFKLDTPNEAMPFRAVKGKMEKNSRCEGQFLFFSNAKKKTDNALPNLLSRTCPKDVFLLDATVTETWWTTIIYSRSCIELEAHCPVKY